MTQQEFQSYRFSSGLEPSDELLDQLMEKAARKVRKSNRDAKNRYFEALRHECDAAKYKAARSNDGNQSVSEKRERPDTHHCLL